MSNSYKLFSNVVLVEGAFYNALYDLDRQTIFRIPKENSKFLKEDLITVNEQVNENFGLLLSHELIHQLNKKDDAKSFPKIDFKFDTAEILTNIIISFSTESKVANDEFIKSILHIIDQTLCTSIQLRFSPEIEYIDILEILALLNKSRIRHIGLVLKAGRNIMELISKLENNYPRIGSVIFYDMIESLNIKNRGENLVNFEVLNHIHNDFPRFESLNDLRFLYFRPNIKSFTEAINYNLYQNKKLYIENNGDVFASPFQYNKIGNIFQNNILNILDNEELKRSWKITKDVIETCKDCEFRYVCCDGREPIYDDKTDIFKIESVCQYNPVLGEFDPSN